MRDRSRKAPVFLEEAVKKYGWIALAAFLADRGTKLMWDRIPREGRTLIPGVIGLLPVRNTGAAFSLFSGVPWLPAALSLAILAGGFFLLRGKELSGLSGTGVMLALGGAAGNLLDRLVYGSVPDMIELLFVRFAVFNLADVCVVVGCLLAAADLFRRDAHG